ncbi:DUF4280 domain-containing protein [Lacrimispora sp. BS-2]|uniref:DUF4280 domain-containing protein n=1 Tax=Lacrimispora sp. BS-2 TaxID=3151850 RepID=A0AAU7PLF3_9FIRM
MADLKDTYVVHGACTTCTCGMRKSRTVLEKSHGVFFKDRALMTVNDCKPENIICFGGCYSMENPDTAAEAQKIQMDVEKDCPNTFTDTVMNFFAKKDQKESSDAPLRVVGICTPKIISAEWDNGGNTVEVNGEVPLLAGAKVYCLYGGEIEIIDSGQPEAGDMSQVEISPHSIPLSGSPGSNAESPTMGAVAAGLAAIPGMPKQAVAGMIGASKASSYGKSKTSDVEGPGSNAWLSNLENDTSISLTNVKKKAMITAASVLIEQKFELAFIAGVLGNIKNEGNIGMFESSNYASSPGDKPDYLKYMDKFHNYRNDYSGQSIVGKSLSKLNAILTNFNNMNWYDTQEKSRVGFGLGCVQWTFDRTYQLIGIYIWKWPREVTQ